MHVMDFFFVSFSFLDFHSTIFKLPIIKFYWIRNWISRVSDVIHIGRIQNKCLLTRTVFVFDSNRNKSKRILFVDHLQISTFKSLRLGIIDSENTKRHNTTRISQEYRTTFFFIFINFFHWFVVVVALILRRTPFKIISFLFVTFNDLNCCYGSFELWIYTVFSLCDPKVKFVFSLDFPIWKSWK